jgi:2,5-diketo-D-gluconate reductase B
MHLELHGARVPRLGFGTWQITGDECAEAVRDALELGYRHLDTARVYENERAVGEGLRAVGVAREDVWITTKVWYDDLRPDAVRASAESSLADLGVDAVDLLLIHWPNPEIPLADTLGAMGRLRDEGLVRHLGVSNFPAGPFEQALALQPILTNQVEYHPFLSQDALLAIAQARDSSVTAYAPLGRGRALRDPTLREIAAAHGRGPAAVCLRWLLDHHPRTLVLPKAASHANRVANLDLGFSLTDEERARIDALPKDRRDFSPSWALDWDA